MNESTKNRNPEAQGRRHAWLAAGACVLWLAMLVAGVWNEPLFMDEYSFLKNVAGFAENRSLVPVYARYPTLYSYLIAPPVYLLFLAFFRLQGYGWADLKDALFLRFLFAEHVDLWVWAARVVTMLFSVATLWLVLKALRRRGGGAWPLVCAAAVLMADPTGLFAHLSSHGLADIPMAFGVTAAMLLCGRAVRQGTRRELYWASFIGGLAASAKFNGLMVIFPLLLAPVLAAKDGRVGWAVWGWIPLLMAAGFAVGSPVFLFAPQTYLEGFTVERGILLGGGHMGAHAANWIWLPRLLQATAPTAAALAVVGIGYCALRRRPEDLLFLGLLVPSFLILGALSKKTLWYFVYLYPLLALYAGHLTRSLRARLRTRWLREPALAALLAFFLAGGPRVAAGVRQGLQPDNRRLAREWIQARVAAGAAIAVDWAYVPELRDIADVEAKLQRARDAGSPHVPILERHYGRDPQYRLTRLHQVGHNWPALAAAGADYLMTSSWCFGAFFPENQDAMPQPGSPLYARFMFTRAFYAKLLDGSSGFRPLKTFNAGSGPDVRIYTRLSAGGAETEGMASRGGGARGRAPSTSQTTARP